MIGVRPSVDRLTTKLVPFTTVPNFGASLRYQRREFHAVRNTVTWPHSPERTGPRSAAVLVRRMRASTQACSEVSSAAPRPLRCARDPRTRTAALHKVPLSLGRICSSGWHPRGVRPTAGLLSFTRRLPRIPCSLRGLAHGTARGCQGLEPVPLTRRPGKIFQS